jgi:hypothetical protein
MPESTEVTWVEDDICVCNNCGAFAGTPQKISHHKTCQPGEAKRWEAFYSEANEEEAAMGFEDWAAGKDWEMEDPYCNEFPTFGHNSNWRDNQKEVELAFDVLVHTTKEAYLLQIGKENFWFPKSRSTLNMTVNKNTVLVPKWLMAKKGLERYRVDFK